MDPSTVDEKQIPDAVLKQPGAGATFQHPADVDSTPGNRGSDLDAAYLYLAQHPNEETAVDLKALRRKIDWWIVPIAFACYTMQFIDKVMINVC
jgi:hypothetical protein